jgi:hypothetical protein
MKEAEGGEADGKEADGEEAEDEAAVNSTRNREVEGEEGVEGSESKA